MFASILALVSLAIPFATILSICLSRNPSFEVGEKSRSAPKASVMWGSIPSSAMFFSMYSCFASGRLGGTVAKPQLTKMPRVFSLFLSSSLFLLRNFLGSSTHREALIPEPTRIPSNGSSLGQSSSLVFFRLTRSVVSSLLSSISAILWEISPVLPYLLP